MGRLADEVQNRLRDRLVGLVPAPTWHVEHRIGGTPVDVVGVEPSRVIAVELEWRRADPADNTAKLFRHLTDGAFDVERVDVFQVFTAYYDLESGAVSSKRANAEFVGEVAADSLAAFEYHAVDLAIEPPRGDGDLPPNLESAVERVAREIAAVV